MNNSNYAAEQIVKMLIKRGWVSTDAYDVNNLISDISTIITNAAIANINLASSIPSYQFSNCDTTTFSIDQTIKLNP
jgi:hypothetical protein